MMKLVLRVRSNFVPLSVDRFTASFERVIFEYVPMKINNVAMFSSSVCFVVGVVGGPFDTSIYKLAT